MKIQDSKRLNVYDIDWSRYKNRLENPWAGKVVERAGFTNKGYTDESVFLIKFTDGTYVSLGIEVDDNNDDIYHLSNKYIPPMKCYGSDGMGIIDHHCYIDDKGRVVFDPWCRLMIDFGFWEISDEEVKRLKKENDERKEKCEYEYYLRLKEKFEKMKEKYAL